MSTQSKFRQVLQNIYQEPHGITLITGAWKTGKTNFALHLLELLMEMGLVSEAAGNIRIFKDVDYEVTTDTPVRYIDNFALMKAWMYKDSHKTHEKIHRKYFIFDESMGNAPSKRAMTQLNAEWQKVVPELSKGKVQLIALTQEESMTERIFRHPTFNIATWTKINLPKRHPQHLKRVRVSSKLLKESFIFNNISQTNIIYNPYLIAPWSMEPLNVETMFDDCLELKIARSYATGLSTDKIVELFPEVKDRKEATRYVKKGIVLLLDKWQVAKVSSGIS